MTAQFHAVYLESLLSLFIRTHQGTSGGEQADVILQEHSPQKTSSVVFQKPVLL